MQINIIFIYMYIVPSVDAWLWQRLLLFPFTKIKCIKKHTHLMQMRIKLISQSANKQQQKSRPYLGFVACEWIASNNFSFSFLLFILFIRICVLSHTPSRSVHGTKFGHIESSRRSDWTERNSTNEKKINTNAWLWIETKRRAHMARTMATIVTRRW